MTLSIIIPTFNEALMLPSVLDHLLRLQDIDEIIVADGGSTDTTREIAAAKGTIVRVTELGRGTQIDAAWRIATTDIICVLHADSLLPQEGPARIRSALSDPKTSLTAFRLSFNTTRLDLKIVAWAVNLRSNWRKLPYGDQALACRRQDLQDMGGLPHWPYLDDVYLVEAMQRRGRIELLPCHVVTSGRRYSNCGTWNTVRQHRAIMSHWREHHKPPEFNR
ncbi:TIGR04283 family arsenosugar biosynthesis glycosyltransferase [candidate division KSB1 bacterium]|nr:TIGR04283 family arsenosugar biosynthesis glycosyltransferase [candidate division KSB1 bacterium]